jgi:hypothetical protein
MEVGNTIWNIFSFWQLLPHLHGFWIIQRIPGQTDWTELWSDRSIASLIANAPELHFGQEVLHGDLQGLDSDLI